MCSHHVRIGKLQYITILFLGFITFLTCIRHQEWKKLSIILGMAGGGGDHVTHLFSTQCWCFLLELVHGAGEELSASRKLQVVIWAHAVFSRSQELNGAAGQQIKWKQLVGLLLKWLKMYRFTLQKTMLQRIFYKSQEPLLQHVHVAYHIPLSFPIQHREWFTQSSGQEWHILDLLRPPSLLMHAVE